MKTLAEVITEIEECGFIGTLADALHYLREHRRLEMAFVKAMADLEDNPPLTWDELKTMEGKPVWVVTGTKGGRWGMFDGVWTKDNEDCVMFVYGHRKYAVCKIRLLGKTWQAYRKEHS